MESSSSSDEGRMESSSSSDEGRMESSSSDEGRMESSSSDEGRMESSSDEEEVHTFVQVLSDKYNPDNFPYSRGQGLGIVLLPTPPGSPSKDRLFLPSVLVVNGCMICRAGDASDIANFCGHVVELDLSHNRLSDWREVSTIVSNIPNLDFVNLSMNPLQGALESELAQSFSRVRRLVLINTHISWTTVHTLTRNTPLLEELFLCLNELSSVEHSGFPCSSLRLLHITENRLHLWSEVRKLGLMFPGLHHLVLAHNLLDSLEDTEEGVKRLFPNLRTINLNHTGLSSWSDIDRLNFFPSLVEVKAKGIPLLQELSAEERRSLLLARLPSVLQLNGSAVSEGEREDAERFFIRYHQETGGGQQLPHRYSELIQKYGELAPLAEVDLSPCCPLVDVLWGDRTERLGLSLDQTVGELKKKLRLLLQLPNQSLRLFYIDRDMSDVLGPEEMRCGSRALHSYGIRDGDQILVVLRGQGRTSSTEI